ncbi:MAG: AAA family ATPase [Candidatus Aerophobetes bacterium]|nr:AAA family ATPase [Candidatus Aerophobetes bacterium]
MKRYVVEFKKKNKETVLIKPLTSERVVKVDFPLLEENIYLPVYYNISLIEGGSYKRIGKLSAWIAKNYPSQDYHIRTMIQNKTTHLSFQDEQILILKSPSNIYDIPIIDKSKLSKKRRKNLEENGFFKGYRIKRNVSIGSFYLFRKNEKMRGWLELEEEFDYMEFLSLVVIDRLISELKDKEAKAAESVEIEREISEGKYSNFILSNYPLNKLTEAVEYVDQKGEWGMFCELMDKGKPVLLNGPTGGGKSTMVKWYAYLNNIPFYMSPTGNRETTMDDIVGSWVPADPKPIKAPGALSLAMVHDGIFYFEEIGPVDPGVLYGLHGVLDDKKITIQSQYGFEVIQGEENFKMISSGNLDSKYTSIELSDAFLERWAQIRIRYPDKEGTIKIFKLRAPKLDDKIAEVITDLLFDFRQVLSSYRRDMGLRGAVEVCQALQSGKQPLKKLIEVYMLNPKSTYESDKTLYKKLMEKVSKRIKE